jgi:hypothetical protein
MVKLQKYTRLSVLNDTGILDSMLQGIKIKTN